MASAWSALTPSWSGWRARLGIQSECNDKKYKYKQRQEHFPIRIFELLYGRIVEILPREKGPHHNGQHVDGSQQSGYQQTGNPEVSHRIATLYGSMLVVMFTIVYGCSRAVKETHLKRRLAYSTISNLSYILFGVTIMTPLGLVGALTHLIFHAVIKICSFFCAGAIIHQTEKQYVHELDGMG